MKINWKLVCGVVAPIAGSAFLLSNLQQQAASIGIRDRQAAQAIPPLPTKAPGAIKPRPTPIAPEPLDREFSAPLRITGQDLSFAGDGRYLVQNSSWVGELFIYNRKTHKTRSQHFKKENEIGRDGADVLVALPGTNWLAGVPNLRFGGYGSIALYDVTSEANFRLIARNQIVGSAIDVVPSRGEFVAASREGDLCFWSAKSGEITRRWKHFTPEQTGNPKASGERYAPGVIAVSPDEKKLATAGVYLNTSSGNSYSSTLLDKPIVIWDAETGTQLLSCEKPGYPPSNDSVDWSQVEMTSLVWSPDGQWLATDSRGNGVVVWNAKTGKIKAMLPHPQNRTGNRVFYLYNGGKVLFSPDSRLILAPGNHGTIDVYDVSSSSLTRQIKGGGPMAFAPDTKDLFYQISLDNIGILAAEKL